MPRWFKPSAMARNDVAPAACSSVMTGLDPLPAPTNAQGLLERWARTVRKNPPKNQLRERLKSRGFLNLVPRM
jgi:hypothetical protein